MRTIFLLLIACGAGHVAIADSKTETLDIYFIDVEGGAATLIVTPVGESILIDSGYPDYNGRDRDRILKTLKEEAELDVSSLGSVFIFTRGPEK